MPKVSKTIAEYEAIQVFKFSLCKMGFSYTEKIQAKHKFSGTFVSKFNISLRKTNSEIFLINFTYH
jgi:hypothetical protein